MKKEQEKQQIIMKIHETASLWKPMLLDLSACGGNHDPIFSQEYLTGRIFLALNGGGGTSPEPTMDFCTDK